MCRSRVAVAWFGVLCAEGYSSLVWSSLCRSSVAVAWFGVQCAEGYSSLVLEFCVQIEGCSSLV